MGQMNVNEVLAQLRVQQGQAIQQKRDEETPTTDFAALLKNSIDTVNETQQQASELARAFETGETDVPLAEVMVSLQKASVSFQAMVEVRNKLVEAYKDIMNMQM